MPWNRINASVVIVAHRFNPSIITQGWLIKKGVIADADLQPGYVFTELFSQVTTKQFVLLVVPEQLQFLPIGTDDEVQTIIVEKLGAIVAQLPETPFRAIGMNFNWHLTPGDKAKFAELSRNLFGRTDQPLYRFFDSPTDHFGAYLSKDLKGCRLKLDIKPVLVADGDAGSSYNAIQFVFNFHADLAANPAEQIQQLISRWSELRLLAEAMIDAVQGSVQS